MWPDGLRARARAASCATRSTRCASSTASRSRSSPSRPGGYLRAARELRRRTARERFDVVHAHFGLTAWPALALRGAPHVVTLHGTDLRHPRSRRITRAALPFVDLVGGGQPASSAREVPGAGERRRVAVLPVRRRPRPLPADPARRGARAPRPGARRAVPALPGRPRAGRSSASTARRRLAGDTRLLTLGRVHPVEVPLYVNAANAVLVPSAHEGFGLAVLEALACDVPVLATPVGVHPAALDERRRDAVRAVRSRRVAGRRSRRTCRPPTRASRAATGPRCGRPADGATRARRLGRGATVARRGAEFGCRFRMKGPLHAIRRRRAERPANGVDTAQAAPEAPTQAQPTAGLASAPPRPAADQAPPTAELGRPRRRPPRSRRRHRGPRRPGAGPRPPELPPARPPAPAPALPAPRARAGLPRPRRPRLRPAPLRAGQRPALVDGKLTALVAVDGELRALEHALDDRRPLTELREPGDLGVLALRRAARQRGPLLPLVRHAGARAARDRRGRRGREPARRRRRAAAAGPPRRRPRRSRSSPRRCSPSRWRRSRRRRVRRRRARARARARGAARSPAAPAAARRRASTPPRPPTASSRPRSCAGSTRSPATAAGDGDGEAVAQPTGERREP